MLSLLVGKGSLPTPLHSGSGCTRVLSPAPQLPTKAAETTGTMGGFYFFFLIVFTLFYNKNIYWGQMLPPDKQSMWAAHAAKVCWMCVVFLGVGWE